MINNFSDILKKSDFLLDQAESQEQQEYGHSLGSPLPAIFLVLISLTHFHQCLQGPFDHMHPKCQSFTIVLDHYYCFLFPQ